MPIASHRPLVCDHIECVLAQHRTPARIVRVSGYAHSLYIHMETDRPIYLSRQAAEDIWRIVGYAPEWTEGQNYIAFRKSRSLFPINPVDGHEATFEWRAP